MSPTVSICNTYSCSMQYSSWIFYSWLDGQCSSQSVCAQTATYAGESLVGKTPRSRPMTWRARVRRVAVDPWESDPSSAALGSGWHKSEGVVQQGVHLLPCFLDGGLWGHVRWWGRGMAGRRGSGGWEDIICGGRTPVRGSWALVRVRLENIDGKELRKVAGSVKGFPTSSVLLTT